MSVLDDIDAVEARTDLTRAEKNTQENILRAVAARDAIIAFAGALPKTWGFSKSGVSYTVTLTRAACITPVRQSDGSVWWFEATEAEYLGLWITGTKNAIAIRWRTPPAPCWLIGGTREDVRLVIQGPRPKNSAGALDPASVLLLLMQDQVEAGV